MRFQHSLLVLSAVATSIQGFTPLTYENLPQHLSSEGLGAYMAFSEPQKTAIITALASFGVADAPSLRFSPSGKYYIVDPAPSQAALATPVRPRRAISDLTATKFDAQGLPQLSSKPGARNKLYLDFNGHSTNRNSPWKAFSARPFSLDNNPNTFNTAEQLVIEEIWQRVTEDFSPFQYDVTTIEPTSFTRWISHALITRSKQTNGKNMPESGGGGVSGVAFFDTFGTSDNVEYSPALIYSDVNDNRPDFIAETLSHEVGHNLGLSHDGRDFPGKNNDEGYFAGNPDPNNPVSWAPIMGFSDLNSITQWSKGEYPKASNKEDDVAILTRKLGTEIDEAGDDIGTAAKLQLTNNKGSATGIIATQQDVDVYEIVVPKAGILVVTAEPWMADRYTQGNNLDIELVLLDNRNQRLALDSPDRSQSCRISLSLPASGQYYIALRGVGAPGAYSDYSSLGQYDVQAEFAPGNTEASTTSTSTTTSTKTTAKTTSTKATTTTKKDVNDDDDGFASSTTTTTTTTTWYGEECLCTGSTLTSNKRRQNVAIRFDKGCSSGHTFHVCLDRMDNSNGAVDLTLYRRNGRQWTAVTSMPSLEPQDEYICHSYTVSSVSRGTRFQLRLSNPKRARVSLTYGRRRYNNANQCVSE